MADASFFQRRVTPVPSHMSEAASRPAGCACACFGIDNCIAGGSSWKHALGFNPHEPPLFYSGFEPQRCQWWITFGIDGNEAGNCWYVHQSFGLLYMFVHFVSCSQVGYASPGDNMFDKSPWCSWFQHAKRQPVFSNPR